MCTHIFKSELINENRTSIVLVNGDRQMLCEVKRTGDKTDYVPYEFFTKPKIAEQTSRQLRQGVTLTELATKLGVSRLDWGGEVKGPISIWIEGEGSDFMVTKLNQPKRLRL